MKNSLLDLSEKLDPISIEILSEIEKSATDIAIPFFVVGATARDIILQYVHDIKPKRATSDIDIGIIIIEIKAGSAVTKRDFTHLRWFQKNLAKKQVFIGIILYTGEHPASFGNNLWAVPFGLLWS